MEIEQLKRANELARDIEHFESIIGALNNISGENLRGEVVLFKSGDNKPIQFSTMWGVEGIKFSFDELGLTVKGLFDRTLREYGEKLKAAKEEFQKL